MNIDITFNAITQIALYFAALLLLVKPLGSYMANVYSHQYHPLYRVFGFIENGIYRLAGIKPDEEMGWQKYALSVIYFSAGGFVLLFLILVFQNYLPLNPQGLPGLDADLAFGTTASFISNVKGRNRHIVTDIMGNMLNVKVHAANWHDTKSGCGVAARALEKYPSIESFSADAGYRGTFVDFMQETFGITVVISQKIKDKFAVIPIQVNNYTRHPRAGGDLVLYGSRSPPARG